METDDADDLGTEVGGAVVRLHRRLRFERADDQLGDTPSAVLGLLTRRGSHTLRELAEHEHVSPPAMNQTVNQLVAAGYVAREPDPTDGRKVRLVATDRGIEVATETRRRRHAWLESQLKALSTRDRQTLRDAARILREVTDA